MSPSRRGRSTWPDLADIAYGARVVLHVGGFVLTSDTFKAQVGVVVLISMTESIQGINRKGSSNAGLLSSAINPLETCRHDRTTAGKEPRLGSANWMKSSCHAPGSAAVLSVALRGQQPAGKGESSFLWLHGPCSGCQAGSSRESDVSPASSRENAWQDIGRPSYLTL